MKTLVVSLFIFSSLSISGQVKTNLNDVIIVPTDTQNSELFKRQKNTFWKEWIKKFVSESGFVDVEKSSAILIFRISSLTNAVTITTDDYNNFQGTFARYLKCQNNILTSYSQKINQEISKKIYDTLISNSVFDIPSDNDISGWSGGFDGREILIEKKENGIYSMKEYWTPEIFPDIPEARIINNVDKEIFGLLTDYDFPESLLLRDCEYIYNGIKGIKIENAKSKKRLKKK